MEDRISINQTFYLTTLTIELNFYIEIVEIYSRNYLHIMYVYIYIYIHLLRTDFLAKILIIFDRRAGMVQ